MELLKPFELSILQTSGQEFRTAGGGEDEGEVLSGTNGSEIFVSRTWSGAVDGRKVSKSEALFPEKAWLRQNMKQQNQTTENIWVGIGIK